MAIDVMDTMILAGAGQIGMAIARHMGHGMKIIVGDKRMENAIRTTDTMNQSGFDAVPVETDLASRSSILALIEKAQSAISEEEAAKMAKKMKENSFDLEDYLQQLNSMKKMGSMRDMLDMIPGMGQRLKGANLDVDEKQLEKTKAIILSMTPKERRNPQILNASRRRRIARGSGTEVQDVNKLLNQFEQTKQMVKKLASGKMPFPMKGFK